MATSLIEAQEMLVKLEENNDVQSFEILKIQMEHEKIQKQWKKKFKDLNEDKALLEIALEEVS